MSRQFPEFGLNIVEAEYSLRPGGYVVVFNDRGEVAVVSTPKGLFLPGGGQSPTESAEETAVREALEECGLRILPGASIGIADELVFAEDEGRYYRKRCSFFLAKAIEQTDAREPDHELLWLAPEDAIARLRHESQRWAVATACRMTGA